MCTRDKCHRGILRMEPSRVWIAAPNLWRVGPLVLGCHVRLLCHVFFGGRCRDAIFELFQLLLQPGKIQQIDIARSAGYEKGGGRIL